jgi:hypothetical protein
VGVGLNRGDSRFEAAEVRIVRFEHVLAELTVGFQIWENQSPVGRPIPSFSSHRRLSMVSWDSGGADWHGWVPEKITFVSQ